MPQSGTSFRGVKGPFQLIFIRWVIQEKIEPQQSWFLIEFVQKINKAGQGQNNTIRQTNFTNSWRFFFLQNLVRNGLLQKSLAISKPVSGWPRTSFRLWQARELCCVSLWIKEPLIQIFTRRSKRNIKPTQRNCLKPIGLFCLSWSIFCTLKSWLCCFLFSWRLSFPLSEKKTSLKHLRLVKLNPCRKEAPPRPKFQFVDSRCDRYRNTLVLHKRLQEYFYPTSLYVYIYLG